MADEITYRCYCCKQVFTEYSAREHFGDWLKKDLPKCVEVINGTANWGGGIHDPFIRLRKDHYGELQARVTEAEAQLAALRAAAPSAPAPVQAGMVMVPREPTEAMRFAIWFDQYKTGGATHEEATELANRRVSDPEQRQQDVSSYRAMLAALAAASAKGKSDV